jgi:hypothetical protein
LQLIFSLTVIWRSSVHAFVARSWATDYYQYNSFHSPSFFSLESTARAGDLVDQLIQRIDKKGENAEKEIKDIIQQLTVHETEPANASDFDPLIGYYNVSCTLTSNPRDNPVGGKWTRNGSTRNLWVIRRTLQHVLEKGPNSIPNAVAQAVNVIRLDLLFGLVPVWIVLRGDAVPISQDNASPARKLLTDLSGRAVRVYFDRPRIAFGKVAFSFGPTSSVVLDTPYVDTRIRIGKGGTSGTLFVFRRVNDTEATAEWKWLLDERQKFLSKRKTTLLLGTLGLFSMLGVRFLEGLGRRISLSGVFLSSLCLIWASVATGGIETRGETYTPGK